MRLLTSYLRQQDSADQTAQAAIVLPVQPHLRSGIWLYWRDPPARAVWSAVSISADMTIPVALYLLYG